MINVLISLFTFFITFFNFVVAQHYLTLREALQMAKKNNLYLKSQQLNINISQTDTITARLFPNPLLENEHYYITNPKYFAQGTDMFNNQNIQIFFKYMQPIPIAGQRANQIELARKNVMVSYYTYKELERNILLEVANKWIEAWVAVKQLQIIQIAKNNIDSLLLINQIRFKNQMITQTELYRTELLSKQYDFQLKNSLQEVSNKLNELKTLIGITDSIQIDQKGEPVIERIPNYDSLVKYSLHNRSDIQISYSLIQANEINIKLQKSLSIPQPQIGFIYNPQNSINYFGPSFSINIPWFHRNQGEIKKSYLLKEQSEKQLLALKNNIYSEIKISYENFKLQQKNIENFNLLLNQAQSILDNVKYTYLKGGTTIVDYLEAQRSWLETQEQHYHALQSYYQSYIQLLYASGLINQIIL